MKKTQKLLSGYFTLTKIIIMYVSFLFTKTDKRLKLLKNKHIGERCFIVGLGPSLSVNDLNALKKSNETCFSVNRVYRMFGATEWRPSYFMLSDRAAQDAEMVEAIKKMEREGVVTICGSAVNFSSEVETIRYRGRFFLSPLTNSKIQFFRNLEKPCKYSTNPEKYVYDGSTCIHSIIQLAGYMGFSEVYLIGCDCDSSEGRDYNEYIKIKTDGQKYAKEGDAVIKDYQSIKDDMERKGVTMRVFNATRGGRLEVFPRVNFDELLTESNIDEE